MPLDPSIILGANVNAGEVAQKTQANLQQQQAAQQQLQLQQYGVAQAKQDFEDQQNFRKAFVQANGDPDLAVSTALKLGVSPKMIQAFKQQQLAMQTAQAGLSEKQLANQQAKHDMAYPVLTRLTSLTPEQYAAQLPSTVDGLVKQGSLTPEEGTRYGSMSQDDAKLYLAQLLNAKGLAEQTTANARAGATAVSQAKLPGELQDLADKHADQITKQTDVKRQNVVREATSAYTGAATPQDAAVAYKKVLDKYSGDQDVAGFALPSPEALAQAPNPKAGADLINAAGMTAEQRTQAAQAAANAAQTDKFHGQELAQGNNRLAIESANLNIRRQEYNQKFGDPNSASDGVKQLAQGLINGQISPTDVRRMPGGEQALQLATTSPGWTDQKYATLKSFKTGKDGQDLANLVMLDKHMGTFDKDSAAQGLRINPYSANAAKVGQDANDLSSVFGKLVKGGVLSVKEHEEYMSRLNSRLPSTRAAAVDSLKELIAGRIDGMRQKFQNGTGMDLPDSMLGAAAPLASSPSPAPQQASAKGPKGRPSLDSIFGGAK